MTSLVDLTPANDIGGVKHPKHACLTISTLFVKNHLLHYITSKLSSESVYLIRKYVIHCMVPLMPGVYIQHRICMASVAMHCNTLTLHVHKIKRIYGPRR